MFLRGEPTAWYERTVQPRMYRWNKFRSSLERSFGSFYAEWEIRMVKEFGNSTDDSNQGRLGQYKGAGPSNAPSGDVGDNNSDDGDDEEDPKEQTDG